MAQLVKADRAENTPVLSGRLVCFISLFSLKFEQSNPVIQITFVRDVFRMPKGPLIMLGACSSGEVTS